MTIAVIGATHECAELTAALVKASRMATEREGFDVILAADPEPVKHVVALNYIMAEPPIRQEMLSLIEPESPGGRQYKAPGHARKKKGKWR
jgi:hypothetical protein